MKSTNNNFFSYLIITLIAVFFGVILGATYQQNRGNRDYVSFPSLALNSNQKLDRILKVIKNNYVDSVNTDSLEQLAIGEILSRLDPHTIYLPPREAKSQNENLEGNFDGIGIEYYILNDTLLVTSVRKQGPSEKAGLLRGDKIIEVNGESLLVKNDTDRAVNKLRGKSGTKVKVAVIRTGSPEPISLHIQRGKIVVSSIDAALMLKPNIGFIKVSRFGANTAEDFDIELNALQKKGMKSLILDLRGNGGGYLSAATALADQFLADGQLIVYTKGLHEPRTDYKATGEGMFEQGRLVVLIDEGTASASEVLAGAIQDLDRGTIVGRRSFGKGLVQEQFGFNDGSAMNLTIARYYTASGRSIQKPYNKDQANYKNEINYRYAHGDYTSLDSALSDATFKKSYQYKTANGRVVYGGGGIMPDVFVPLDTTGFTPLYRHVTSADLIRKYVYGKLTNSIKISRFEDLKDFETKFQVRDGDYQQFLSYCKGKNIPINLKDAALSKPLISQQIKALLGRYYFGEEGFYSLVNQHDDFVLTALNQIKNPV